MQSDGRLLALEEQFWKGDADFYRDTLAPEARMVFADPVGCMEKDAAVASIRDAARWQDVELADVDQVSLSSDTVLLTYRVRARRAGDDDAYQARASSVYVKRDGAWLLAFHQQSPPLSGT